MTHGVISLNHDTLLDEALLVMGSKSIRHLLVTDTKGAPQGVITHTDIVRKLEEDFFKAPRPVSEYMSTKIKTIQPETKFNEVVTQMYNRKISCLVITEKDCPVGIVTERDIVRFMQGGAAEDTLISQLMSAPIIMVEPNMSLFEASRIMERRLIRHLVIWDGDKRLGLLTNTDVVRSIRDNYRSYLEKEAMRTRRILDLIHEGVIEINCSDYRIAWINQTGAKMFGYDGIKQAIGNNFLQLIDEANRKVIEDDFVELRSKSNLQCKVICCEQKFTMLLSYHVINDDYKQEKSYRILVRDITSIVENRKLMEERLLKQKKQFQALFDNTTDAIVFFDIHKQIQMANQQFLNMFGYTMDEVKDQHISHLVDSQQLLTDHISNNVFSGKNANRETIRYTKSGKKLHVLLKGGPVIVDDEITGGYAVYSDITERKQMMYELRNSEEKHRNLIQTMSEGMALLELIYDEKGIAVDYRFIETNTAFTQHTGISQERIRGRLGTDIFKNINPPFLLEFETTVKTGLPQKLETYIDSIERYIRISVFSPMQGYFATLFEDITEQKRKEEQIQYLIYHDILTDIYNRAYFEKELKQVDKVENLPICVVMADLNGLKLINDAFGHDKGDELIKLAAKAIKEVSAGIGIPARIGGDEFAIILPKTSKEQGERFIKLLKEKTDKLEIEGICLSISLGLSIKETAATSIHEVVQQSDVHMYNHKLLESQSAKNNLINSLLMILEEKTCESREHCQKVMELGVLLGRAIGLTEDEIEKLRVLALLHDIGNITIPESILNKPRNLSQDEWDIIKKHPESGYRIVSAIPEFAFVAEYILCHHERVDGTGYPRGLMGDGIPKIARVLAVVDAYDVMTRNTIYREALNQQQAEAELLANAGTQFDFELVEVFIEEVLRY